MAAVIPVCRVADLHAVFLCGPVIFILSHLSQIQDVTCPHAARHQLPPAKKTVANLPALKWKLSPITADIRPIGVLGSTVARATGGKRGGCVVGGGAPPLQPSSFLIFLIIGLCEIGCCRLGAEGLAFENRSNIQSSLTHAARSCYPTTSQ